LFINVSLMRSDVEISTDVISWIAFGWRWKIIKWAAVNHMRIYNVWDFEPKNGKMYCLYETEKP
jgi:hypothetical protein